MATITLSIPEELKMDMDSSPAMDWSEVAREAIRVKALEIKLLKSIVSRSKLTEKDALDFGKRINTSLHQRFVKEHPEAYS